MMDDVRRMGSDVAASLPEIPARVAANVVAFVGLLFFQVVQRVDGYDGYGAPNAPFRIAAQTRLAPAKGVPRY